MAHMNGIFMDVFEPMERLFLLILTFLGVGGTIGPNGPHQEDGPKKGRRGPK